MASSSYNDLGLYDEMSMYLESQTYDAENIEHVGYDYSSHDSSDSESDGDVNLQDNMNQIFKIFAIINREWVDRVAVNNSYVQFIRNEEEWNNEIDFDGQHSFERQPSESIIPNELVVGGIYKTKSEVQFSITAWSILNHVQYKKKKSDKDRLVVICVESEYYSWKLRASKSKRIGGAWKIATISCQHSCANASIQSDHHNCTSKFIARFIVPILRNQVDIKPREIIGRINAKFSVNVLYIKAWDSRRKAIKIVFGGWD